MKKIRVAYPLIPNAGDLLNEYICRDIFGIEAISSKPVLAQLSGIGSGLGYFQYSDQPIKRKLQAMSSFVTGDVHIWGTGFIRHPLEEQENSFYRKDTFFHAVRGKMSKRRVEGILGRQLDIPICDGGILTPMLFKKPITKKYPLGIIPHFKEQHESVFQELLRANQGAVIINLRGEPMKVFEQIGACELVISSSLHGLIIADSFHIPNLHMEVSDALSGDGFKFLDYYSGYDVDHTPFLGTMDKLPTLQDVIERYQIKASVVEQKKEEMLKSFPKKELV